MTILSKAAVKFVECPLFSTIYKPIFLSEDLNLFSWNIQKINLTYSQQYNWLYISLKLYFLLPSTRYFCMVGDILKNRTSTFLNNLFI